MLIAVSAPAFVLNRPVDLIALAVTMLAATRLPILPTLLIGIAAEDMLRHVLG